MSPAVMEIKKKLHLKDGLTYSRDVHSIILTGVRKDIINKLIALLGITRKEMLGVIPISDTQLRRVGDKERLTAQVTEHIVAIAEVVVAGYEILDNPKDFKEWLFENNVVLNNQKPYDFLSTIQGCGLLKTLFHKICHGIPF